MLGARSKGVDTQPQGKVLCASTKNIHDASIRKPVFAWTVQSILEDASDRDMAACVQMWRGGGGCKSNQCHSAIC